MLPTPMRKDVLRVNIDKWWFRSSGAGWHPGLYEWFFRSTRMGSTLRTREEEITYGFLETVLDPDQSVLEFGPGTGHYTVPLARRCARMLTVEVSETMQEHLRGRLAEEGLENVETRLGRLQRVAVRLDDSALSGYESVLGGPQREDRRRCWARDVQGTGCSHLRSGRNLSEALRKAHRRREASYSRQSAR